MESPAKPLGSSASRAQKKAVTRQVIRQAARACFERRGFAETKIGEITSAARVAHGTFYVHFSSKEELMDELLREFNLEFVELLGPLIARLDKDPLELTVQSAVELFIDHWQARAAFVESYMQRVAKGLDRRSLQSGVNQPMLSLLSAALKENSDTPDADVDWELVTHGILAMALRISLQYLFGTGVTKRQAIATIVHMTLGALRSRA